MVASEDPATPYTIHHNSGLDDNGQWRLLAVISSESELYSYSHYFSKFINLGLLTRLRDLKGRWVLAVDATSQISCNDLSVVFAGVLHEDHGFLPIVATMQVYDPFLIRTIFQMPVSESAGYRCLCENLHHLKRSCSL